MNVSFIRCIYDLGECSVLLSIGDVLGNAHIEQHRFLTNEAKLRANPLNVKLSNIDTIQTLDVDE